MHTNIKRVLFWTPRVLGILFAIFLSLFALDVFSEDYGPWQTIGALLLHLVPAFIVVVALVIAWRWEWVGAVLFSALAVFYVGWTWGRFPLVTYLSISGPLVLVGVLFLLNWTYRAQLRTRWLERNNGMQRTAVRAAADAEVVGRTEKGRQAMVPKPEQFFKYSLYTASDADEMSVLLGKVFAQRDPPAVAAGLTPSEFEAFVRLFCPMAAVEGLTIVARSVETGEMCGALLAEDSASEMPEGIDHLSRKFDPIFDILGQLDAEYRSGQTVQRGESIHLFLVGVVQRCAGKGVAQQLVAECLANAVRRGYRLAVTEATNKTSQHIFRKLGFVERVRRSYRDHRFDGQAVFASIAEHGGPILMDKRLTGAGRAA